MSRRRPSGNRLLRYETRGLRLVRHPRVVNLAPKALSDLFTVDSPTSDGRWVVTTTELLLGSATSNTGFLDLRTGATYWLPAGLSIEELLPNAR